SRGHLRTAYRRALERANVQSPAPNELCASVGKRSGQNHERAGRGIAPDVHVGFVNPPQILRRQNFRGSSIGDRGAVGEQQHAIGIERGGIEIVKRRNYGHAALGAKRAKISATCLRSRNAVGSSSSATFGSWASARARNTRLRSPPDSSWTWRAARSRRSKRSSAADAIDKSCGLSKRKAPRCGARPISTISSTVKRNATAFSWPTDATVRANSRRSIESSGRPKSSTLPAPGFIEPPSTLSSVDLPAPFGPTIASISPAATSIETPCSTGTPGYPA